MLCCFLFCFGLDGLLVRFLLWMVVRCLLVEFMFDLCSIECFSDCVVDYVCYCFDYLIVLVDWLYCEYGVDVLWDVVDVGVGIGILVKFFFDVGYCVIVVEFNVVMCVVVE